jgi:orotate phosphoribosyltransferase
MPCDYLIWSKSKQILSFQLTSFTLTKSFFSSRLVHLIRMANLASYQNELIEHAMNVGALKFGSFTLKSGRYAPITPRLVLHSIDSEELPRISPYFFNAGLLSTGSILGTVAQAYAGTIVQQLERGAIPAFDVLFGPAYKGIPLGACTALVLAREHALDVGFAYDRKEAKDHGEGGVLVGAPVQGKRVLILDDVMTAGTAIRGAMATIAAAGGEVIGVVQCLDREEIGRDGATSTVVELERELGGEGKITSILKMRELMKWLETKGMSDELGKMKEYWDQYGYKG